MDRTHNPEFTCMEIYVAYKDYLWMMDFTEDLLEHIAVAVNGTSKVKIGEHDIEFKKPYRRLPMLDAIKEYAGVDISNKNEEELRAICKQVHIEVAPSMGKGKLIDAIFGSTCEHHLTQPTFITDYPIELSPLTKRHRSNPDLTERFELFVNGKEICNAYSELNDPVDQLERFKEQAKLRENSYTPVKPPTIRRFRYNSFAIRRYNGISSALWGVMNGRAVAQPGMACSTGVSTSK